MAGAAVTAGGRGPLPARLRPDVASGAGPPADV